MNNELLNRLKKQAYVYLQRRCDVTLDDNDNDLYKVENDHTIINIGSKLPYRYSKTFHKHGYNLFMEGFQFHLIARILYTDHRLIDECFQQGQLLNDEASIASKKFLNKEIKAKELKQILRSYVEHIYLPLILNAIEDGAVENTMGMEHPETWDALMYARYTIINASLNKTKQSVMDQIIEEIMMICTYGYRRHISSHLKALQKYLPDTFEEIRKLAIKGRLQSINTEERLNISREILKLCSKVIERNVNEIIDTIIKSKSFTGSSLFSETQSEIAVNTGGEGSPQNTKPRFNIDLSDEDYRRIEQMENQEEIEQQNRSLKEIYKREKIEEKQNEDILTQSIKNKNIDELIIDFPLQRHSPTSYGSIAMNSLNQSIQRSNKMARMLKREIMYASKNKTKRKLDHGKKLDQRNLYRASIDGRVFYKHVQGTKKDLCIYILVDNSESMSGDKIINTMKGCYEVARVLQTLKIPFCISTHKAVGDRVQMSDILTFKECTRRELLERIFYMHVSGGTHEEIALEKALKDLSLYKRNKKGFVFVLSDGDTHGVSRIHDLIKIYKKEYDIDVIGIGIQTAKQIEKTYPHGMFIEDINNLPVLLIQKLREISL